MTGGAQMNSGQDVYVFRLLGSIYKKSAGEQESHPTVVNIEIAADSEAEAERMIGNSLKELTVAVESIRVQKEQKERQRRDAAEKRMLWQRAQQGHPSLNEPKGTPGPLTTKELVDQMNQEIEKLNKDNH